ncbi:MAG: serine hydrolase [Anaerolineae bacterium]|nr:serine hydrolase [Anaerolineae bacterium]
MTTLYTLPRSKPEAQGIAPDAIKAFVEAAEQQNCGLHSLMLLRHGHVVAEGWWAPYAPQHPHMLFSLSKSFTSTAIGIAIAEGRLSLDDPVLSFFPEETPKRISRNLAAMRVRHLLSMSTGHAEDTTGYFFKRRDKNWAGAFLARPVKHKPGTHFLYNTGATYMLSAIIQGLTGMTLLDYLQPRLFAPLGIEGATWETCPRGINTGGFGLSVKTEDIAKLGQLYLQKGRWDGEQLLPANWIEEATRKQVDNAPSENPEWEQGYGYQFWRCRHGAYRGDGAFGQYCLVMPGQDAVLAITSGTPNMQLVLDLVWEHLLPAMSATPLPADAKAQTALQEKLSGLALSPQTGEANMPITARVSGKVYTVEKNPLKFKTLSCTFDTEGCTFTVKIGRRHHSLRSTHNAWHFGTTTQDGNERRVAASGAWTAEDTYTMRTCYYETPFCDLMTFQFGDDQLTFTFKTNVSFGPTEFPPLVGHRVD